jgi:glycosyltransferase involved in cell wall biosynthesis
VTPGEQPIDLVAVVVPVHDEAALLGRCLRSLTWARQRLLSGRERPPAVRLLAVLDRCTDASAQVAAAIPQVEVLEVDAGSVGAARDAGARRLLRTAPERTWLACTDADSQVPPTWLEHQYAVARWGQALLLGTVRPGADWSEPHHRLWRAGYTDRDGHAHVHGANLGIRGDVYLACGGFPPVPAHEDVALAAAVRAAGYPVMSSAGHAVRTSGRLTGRAPDGFAAHLSALP